MSGAFGSLDEVLADLQFASVDHDLRRGHHIGREEGPRYEYLVDAREQLTPFYERSGYALEHQSDGYFYLVAQRPTARRTLDDGEMLVGQTLALMFLDPATVRHGGIVERDVILQRLAGLVGQATLVARLHPKRKRYDERVTGDTVRRQFNEALRSLDALGLCELLDDGRVRLRAACLRFAAPARGLDADKTRATLARRGEIVVGELGDDA